MESAGFSPLFKPFYVMLKPVGASCNLACEYCYYLEKEQLYDSSVAHRMSDRLLETFTEQYINSQANSKVLFTWHGGEPTLLPISFYEKALMYQQKYANGRIIENSIQTNGSLLNDEWCRFLSKNNFLVGVSIDGPAKYHDLYRKDRRGKSTFDKLMKNVDLLNQYDISWNAMAVVNNVNVKDPLGFYHFFKSINCRYIQFTPVVERYALRNDALSFSSPQQEREARLSPFSVRPDDWGNFLCHIFDEWVRNDVGEFYIQLFDVSLANWMGVAGGLCTMAKTCGHAGVMEFNGDVYACDHFVFPEYKLGNIHQQTLLEMFYGEKQRKFGQQKHGQLPGLCLGCEFLFACNGECPKNRFVKTKLPGERLNYLCRGYYQFFSYIAPYMDFMKNELLNRRSPANVMSWAQKEDAFSVFYPPARQSLLK